MAWAYLLIAAAFEVLFAGSMKASDGFTRLGWSAVTVVGLVGGLGFLTLALKELPLSIGYSIWTGIGAIGTVVLGVVLFSETFTAVKAAGVAAILTGVVLLHFDAS